MPAPNTMRRSRGAALIVLALSCCRCTSVDPGPNFSTPNVTFDGDYYYCDVEPKLIFAKRCGPGDPSIDPPSSCHFTASAVSGMPLLDHAPVDCADGDHPVDRTQIGAGSAAEGDFESVSLEMSKDVMNALVYTRPSGANGVLYHPRRIFEPGDPTVLNLLETWAGR